MAEHLLHATDNGLFSCINVALEWVNRSQALRLRMPTRRTYVAMTAKQLVRPESLTPVGYDRHETRVQSLQRGLGT